MKLIAILLATFALPLAAQWLNYPEAGVPRTKDGKPNLTAPAPRLNGRPDLSGLWEAERTPVSEFTRVLGSNLAKQQVDLTDVTKNEINIFWGIKREEEPLRPEAAAILKQRANQSDPTSRCLPSGVPSSTFIYSFKMIQAPREIVVIPGDGDPPRQIYTDGRRLPADPQPSWMGYSAGNWQGDTLAVETIGFTEASWLDSFGHPRSESMRIQERFHRRDFGHMDLEMTFDDPKYYTRPFTLKTQLTLIPDSDVLEFVCGENEKDRKHIETQ
jgi:hypothetical protein